MPTSIMQKNYSHCPLKKRPVTIVREEKIKEGKNFLNSFQQLRKTTSGFSLVSKFNSFKNIKFFQSQKIIKNFSLNFCLFLKKYTVKITNFSLIRLFTDSDSEMEPENLSTKPEDLSRTGNYPRKVSPSPIKEEEETFTTETKSLNLKQQTVSPIRIPTPTYAALPYYATAIRKSVVSATSTDDAPLNLSPAASPCSTSEPISLANPINWHKSSAFHPSYLPFPAYPLPYSTETYNALYHQQVSPRSEQLSPYARDSSVSPPSYLARHRDNSLSPPIPHHIQHHQQHQSHHHYERRNSNNNVIKADHLSHHRYMPYPLNHHHHQLMMPVDQASLSPTSSHASFNSYISSRRSVSPISNTSSAEDLTTMTPALSVLMEKTNNNANIQKTKKEGSEKVGAPRYQCPDCGKSYSTYSGLSKHQQFHCAHAEGNQAKKTFVCKFCNKQYASLGALKMHIRTHTLPCKCHLCGKAFSRPWLLQGHIRTHTGEKPFSCQHCHRAFADRSNLRAHLQTHSDVKKYSCTTCSKTFSRMSLLTKHTEGGCPGLHSLPPPPPGYAPMKQELSVY